MLEMIWMIGLGGSLGAVARYLIGNFINKHTSKRFPFPFGTWLVNMTGSFMLGLLTQLYLSNDFSEWIWLFGGAGFCGAFTTFSTFGYETIRLIQSNRFKYAMIYVLSSCVVGVVSAMIGYYFAGWF